MADVQYEVFIDGSLASETLYFWRETDLGDGDGYFAGTVGGVLTLSDGVTQSPWYGAVQNGYTYLSNPNIWPAYKTGGAMGLTPILSGGLPTRTFGWAFAGGHFFNGAPIPPPDPDNPPGPPALFPTYPDTPQDGFYHYHNTKYRYFLRTFRVKQEWSDGTELVGRWTGVGPNVRWTLPENFLDADTQTLGAVRGSVSAGPDYYDEGPPAFDYQLTDEDGIATYYALLGVAIGVDVADNGVYQWWLVKPRSIDAGGFHLPMSTQNLALYVNDGESHVPAEASMNWFVSNDHIFYQQDGGVEHTSGWAIDYDAAWSAGSGMLSCPAPSLQTFTYSQAGHVVLFAAIDPTTPSGGTEFVPANVTFGPYSGASNTNILAVPKGSLLNNLRIQPGEDATEPPAVTEIPLLSASTYPSASAEGEETQLVSPKEPGRVLVVEDGNDVGERYKIKHTGKASNTLTGVTGAPYTANNLPNLGTDLFDGGEVLTQHYDGTWTATDGSGRRGDFKIWIHEDRIETVYHFIKPGALMSGGGLDYCVDPWGTAWLTEAQGNAVVQYHSRDMEHSNAQRLILPETAITSPSRQVKGDHSHLLAGIEGGAVKLWTSKDTDTWITAGTIDAANTYMGCTLRFDPAGLLYCLMVTDAGAVKRRVSTDSGVTWDALDTPTGFPALTPDPIDFRWDRGRWLAAVANASGNVDLYSSPEGEAWTFEQTVATGRMPVLLPLQGRSYLILYMNLGDFSQDFNDDYFIGTWKSRRVFEYESSWSLDAAVIIRKGQGRGMAGFRNTQKAVVAFNSDKDQPLFYRSFDEGSTWISGSDG